MSIDESAESFTQSYASAMASATQVSRTDCAKALGSHYGPGMASYTFGHVHVFKDTAHANENIETHLGRFEAAGIGYDIRMVEHEILPVSTSSALCPVTWEIRPKAGSGVEGWRWRNVYAYRLPPGADKGYWEFVVSDNEVGELMKRFPNFMEM
ncbi:hypothetical protein MBLNU459_g8449t2 [Dothideomycetes sp. NU459]